MIYISRLREQTVESDYAVALYMSDGRSCSPPTFAGVGVRWPPPLGSDAPRGAGSPPTAVPRGEEGDVVGDTGPFGFIQHTQPLVR